MAGLSRFRMTGEWPGAVLVAGLLAIGELVFLLVRIAPDGEFERPEWHTQAGVGAVLLGVSWGLRRRRGLATVALIVASLSIEQALESAWRATASFAQFGDSSAPQPSFWIAGLAVLARSAIPATLLALYASAPVRRPGRWVLAATWALVAAMFAAAVARIAFESSVWPPDGNDPWWYSGETFMANFDGGLPLIVTGLIAIVAGLRSEARRHEHADPEARVAATAPNPGFAPARSLVVGIAAAVLLWVPSTLGFLTRPLPPDVQYGTDTTMQLIWLPVLLALIGFVTSRWSRTLGWLAVAGAFQVDAMLVFYRAVADYVITVPPSTPSVYVAPSVLVDVLMGTGILVQVLAFAATAIALRSAVGRGAVDPAGERSWAIRGAAIGLAIDAWYVGSAWATSGFPGGYELVLLPAYPLAGLVLSLGLWRRLVPAVAEAETVATHPLQPLSYIETVISEVISGGAEHRRRAIEAERARLASELSDLRATLTGLLSDRGRALEPAPAGGAPWRPPQPTSVRRPSDREIDVIRLLADGASNDEIARGLVLSLKTVETHLRRLFARYDVTNRTELAVLAVREGWVEPS